MILDRDTSKNFSKVRRRVFRDRIIECSLIVLSIISVILVIK